MKILRSPMGLMPCDSDSGSGDCNNYHPCDEQCLLDVDTCDVEVDNPCIVDEGGCNFCIIDIFSV